jgi:hypothetical protein
VYLKMAAPVLQRHDGLASRSASILIIAALLGNVAALVLTGLLHMFLRDMPDSRPFRAIEDALIAAMVLGVFAFVWAFVVVGLLMSQRLLAWSRQLIAATSVVSVFAAVAAGRWYTDFLPATQSAFQAAIVVLFSYQAVVYAAVAMLA